MSTPENTAEIVPFDVLKKKIDERDAKPEPVKQETFSPEVESDALANLLVAGLYQGLVNSKIDPLTDENQEILDCVYELVAATTDRHYGVFNELNATRDAQAEHGTPIFETQVFIETPDEETTDA